jgi:cytosine/adenosine deaminase-related metal-dependent hydrolase
MILTSSIIIPFKPRGLPIYKGAIAINQGIVVATGPTDKIIKQFPRHQIHEQPNAVVLPGLINLHTHLELPPLLDTIQARTFPDWVLNLISAKKKLDNKDFAFASQKNINALIRSGTTTVGEICTHGVSPTLIKRSGLRSVVYPEIISMGTEYRYRESRKQKRGRDDGRIQNGLSPHTPYTVSEAVLRQIKKLAEKHKLKLCMHVAESKDESRLLQGKKSGIEKLYEFANWDLAWAPKGSSSIEYLKRIGLLSPNLLAVHAVQASGNDIKLLKKFKVSIAHCPRSNKETRVGRMPLKKFLDAGISVGLGTDSLASSPSLNMWDEMRYAYRIHKKDGISAKDIFYLATICGAQALGMDKEIGTLEHGKKADLIVVPLPKKDTGDIYSDLLRETESCIMGIVNGEIIYLDTDFRRGTPI